MKDICVIYRTDRIGDFVCSVPAIYAVRKMLPQHHIILITHSSIASLASSLPCIDEHRVYDPMNPFPAKQLDYVIVFNLQDKYFYAAAKQVAVNHKVGIWKQTPLWKKLVNFSVKERTETQKMLDFIKDVCPEVLSTSYLPEHPLPYSLEKKEQVRAFLAPFIENNKRIVVLSPIKEGSSKVVADSYYSTIIQVLHARFPHIAIIVAVSEFDKSKGEGIMRALSGYLDRCVLFVNNTDLSTLVALIDACDIFIGSSSGPTHIAGLLNKKVIAFYPHNKGHSPSRWGIPGGKVKYILAEKRVDEIALTHPRRFGSAHLEKLCTGLREFCSEE